MKNLLVIFALLISSQSLFGWGQNGHRIVAKICYDNLTDQARMKVDEALGNEYLAQVATWPDFIRSEPNWKFTQPWHYITIDTDQTVKEVIDSTSQNEKIDNVIEAIDLMTAILSNDQEATDKFQNLMDDNKVTPLNGSIEATALAFLVHFVGDIHQPMHDGKNKDLGGNKISVLFFSERTNLHSVWDSGIIEQEQLSYTEFADFIEKHHSIYKLSHERAEMFSWTEESIVFRELIYNTLYDNTDKKSGLPSLSYKYQHDFLPIVEMRLAAAGYRSAALINSLYE